MICKLGQWVSLSKTADKNYQSDAGIKMLLVNIQNSEVKGIGNEANPDTAILSLHFVFYGMSYLFFAFLKSFHLE